jgi:hypothetical protein
MNSEQQKQMRDSFEAKFSHLTLTPDINDAAHYYFNNTNIAWQGFQAAYTPKPDVEVVARRVYNAKYPNHPRAEIPQSYLNEVQNVINAIFKEQI